MEKWPEQQYLLDVACSINTVKKMLKVLTFTA